MKLLSKSREVTKPRKAPKVMEREKKRLWFKTHALCTGNILYCDLVSYYENTLKFISQYTHLCRYIMELCQLECKRIAVLGMRLITHFYIFLLNAT